MKTIRSNSNIIGLLILASFLTGVLSVAPAVDSPDFMHLTAEEATQTVWAGIFQFLMGCCYAGIVILFYPMLKAVNPHLALGALGFRFVSIGLSFLGIALLNCILIWSQHYVDLGRPDDPVWLSLGEMLKRNRDLINHGWMVLALSLGNLMLYAVLFQGKFIPKSLIWMGLFGTALSCLASGFILFQKMEVISFSYLLMNLPTGIFELLLAGWLISKGLKN
ncbi:DUF4386 domain-containing protein [Algoriphagus sp.]|uniref:DUF4386 domain-containing protein n=1 Tax=Algoriphagus sp. TaxID=1872435 RepID=UPI002625C1D8|nr:DUF4386 domain-containing protein [Algoriphagus sp.]